MSRMAGAVALLLVTIGASACRDEPLTVSTSGMRGAPQASVTGGPNDLDAMQEIVNTFDAAWTAGNPVAYAAQYAQVEDWVGPTGAVLTSPAAIIGLYTNILTNVFAGSTRHSTIRNLTFLTGTIAVLDIDARVTGFSTLPPGVVAWQPGIVRVLEKNILSKRGSEWRIIKHQQTSVAPGIP